MSKTVRDLRTAVRQRLGDEDAIWPGAEIDGYLQTAYQQLAQAGRVFPDWTSLENLPRGFSCTALWERAYLTFSYGVANFTCPDERRLVVPETAALGPGSHTMPEEATDGWVTATIPATADLPAHVTELERVTWDARGIEALPLRPLQAHDTRYEVTQGEVYGYLWQKDGVRTLRKVRVPAARAATYAFRGSWGLIRTTTDLESP